MMPVSYMNSTAKAFPEPNPQDFPRTADGRVYHLGLRHGEVANRIVSPTWRCPPD